MRANRLCAWCAIAASTVGCGIVGSGVPGDELRSHEAFTSVVNESSIDVEIETGAAREVRVTCDDNLVEYIETRVDHAQLTVTQREGSWLQPRTSCRVLVATDALEEVVIAGSGDLEVWSEGETGTLARVTAAGSGSARVEAPVTTPALELRVAGSGDIAVARFEGDDLIAAVGGSGSIRVDEGAGASADALIEGSGDIDIAAVPVTTARGAIEGSGSIQLRCTERLDAYIAGSGDIVVFGDPPARDEVDEGSGSIVHR